MAAAIDVDELDALIEQAGKHGYLWHQFRVDRHGPDVLAGVFPWRNCADLVVLTNDRDSHAFRAPTDPAIDVFSPSHVHWWYGHSEKVGMVWVLRALLTLPHPDEPGGLPPLIAPPPGTGIPGDRIPVSMRRWLGR